jgi:hypothetical protein
MRKSRNPRRGKLEEDDQPLNEFERLVGKSAWKRNIRLVQEPTNGRIGLLIAIRPTAPRLSEKGVVVCHHEETLATTLEVAPGLRFRPKLRVVLEVEMNEAERADYERYVHSLKLPNVPLTP